LHMAQRMPLPLTVSCFSKIQIGFPFWYRLTWIVPDKGPLNGCVCVCVWCFSRTPTCDRQTDRQTDRPTQRSCPSYTTRSLVTRVSVTKLTGCSSVQLRSRALCSEDAGGYLQVTCVSPSLQQNVCCLMTELDQLRREKDVFVDMVTQLHHDLVAKVPCRVLSAGFQLFILLIHEVLELSVVRHHIN